MVQTATFLPTSKNLLETLPNSWLDLVVNIGSTTILNTLRCVISLSHSKITSLHLYNATAAHG